jgi:hypothetical protein
VVVVIVVVDVVGVAVVKVVVIVVVIVVVVVTWRTVVVVVVLVVVVVEWSIRHTAFAFPSPEYAETIPAPGFAVHPSGQMIVGQLLTHSTSLLRRYLPATS